MAKINLKYPDGNLEERELLTAIKKDGLEIAVVSLDNVVNGNKVTGVMLLSDGYYQNIMDDAVWKNITQMLIDSIHGNLSDSDYQKLEGEVNITADPYRQLALRDGNYDSLVQNYSNAIAKLETSQNIDLVENGEALVDNQPVEPDIPNYGEIKDIEPVITSPIAPSPIPDQDVQETSESSVVGNNQGINPEEPIDMNSKASMNLGEGILDSPGSEETTVVSEAASDAVLTADAEKPDPTPGLDGSSTTGVQGDISVSLGTSHDAGLTTDVWKQDSTSVLDGFNATGVQSDTSVSLGSASETATNLGDETPLKNILQFPGNSINNQDNDIVSAIDQVYEEARNEINTILDRTKAKTLEILKNGLNNTKTENLQNPTPIEDGPILELNKAA